MNSIFVFYSCFSELLVAGMDARIAALLAPVNIQIPSQKELVALFKEQRPSAVNSTGKLYREEYLKLVVSIMTCRVRQGHDMADANNWQNRCSVLKEQLRIRGYHYVFPSVARVKQEVIKALEETHNEEQLMFSWSDYSRAVVATSPHFLDDNPSGAKIVDRLLAMGGPVSVKTAMLLKKRKSNSKIAERFTQAFKRASDEVTHCSDRLIGTDLETIQTRYYLDCFHERYLVRSPHHDGAPSDLCLVQRNPDHNENMDDDPEVALEFELKASALSQANHNTRQVTITGIFKRNHPVIVDLVQIRNGAVRFYACLLVRKPQGLQRVLNVETPTMHLGFTANHNDEDKFHFYSVQFRPKLLLALKNCGDYELRHLGDAKGSTPESLAQSLWKIEKLATWTTPHTQKKRLSDIKPTAPNTTIGNANEDRAHVIFASHPDLLFLPRTSVTSAKEDSIIKLGQTVLTVSVRTASPDRHGTPYASLAVYRKGTKVGQTHSEACDVFCFSNAETCIMMCKSDEPLRSALLNKRSHLHWRPGVLDSFVIKIGELDKIEQLFQRSQVYKEVGEVDEVKEDGAMQDSQQERPRHTKRQRIESSQQDEYKLD